MNTKIAAEIQAEQEHGREKYGIGPHDLEHDDAMDDAVWHNCIWDHNERARNSTPMERRQHLIKVAGLAVSAVEAFDRKRDKAEGRADSFGAPKHFGKWCPHKWEPHDSYVHTCKKCGWAIPVNRITLPARMPNGST